MKGYEEVNQYLVVNCIWGHPRTFVFQMFCCLTFLVRPIAAFDIWWKSLIMRPSFYGAIGICEPKIATTH